MDASRRALLGAALALAPTLQGEGLALPPSSAQGSATMAPPSAGTGHHGPTLPHAPTLAELQAAQRHSAELWREVARRRAALSERIGPRGAQVGSFTAADGRTVALHAASVEQARRLFRRLPPELQPERAAAVEAVRVGCARWDAHAEAEGLLELQRHAAAARARADALLHQVAAAAVV